MDFKRNIQWRKHGHRNRARRGSAPHRHSDSNSRLWVGPNRQFKNKVPVQKQRFNLSCFSPSSHSNSHTDDPEAGPLDSRLNIGWDKLSRWIKDFVKAVTSQNQQRNDAFHLNAEPATNSLRAPTRLTCDVTQQQRAAEISWHPRQRIVHFREATLGTNNIADLLNQRKASISN